MRYVDLDGGILIGENVTSMDADALVLDCDGTLVRINRSYNACIVETAGRVLSMMLGDGWKGFVDEQMILAFRMSGGFNNDVDTTYACILAALAYTSGDPRGASLESARRFAHEMARHADSRGVESVEEYLAGIGKAQAVKAAREYTGYPGLVGSSMLATLFDELFYGSELFRRMHGIEPRFNHGKGFIEYDEVVVSRECLSILNDIFHGNVAIVSGRSRIAAEYALRELLVYFNISASVFIEDEDKYVKRNGIKMNVVKPSPYALLRSLKAMDANSAIVVGDSAEDLIMARSVASNGYSTYFIGVYGTSIDAEKQRQMFMDMDSDAILDNVNLLPRLLASNT
ncbi:MAG: HAD family hydrolase [Candidatus Nitrosocaldus sp.]|nr:HAD family hydrolase [Candidatus Nitrosocaldus sp.]MDW8000290.1 HAD family hydrolase [Candidatus Nitrosocaldus sp.]